MIGRYLFVCIDLCLSASPSDSARKQLLARRRGGKRSSQFCYPNSVVYPFSFGWICLSVGQVPGHKSERRL